MKNWIVTFIIVVIIVFVLSGIMFFQEINATVKSNKVKVGDTFMIKANSRNPYDENYLIKGKIIDKCGSYVLYVNEKGDTLSTNIRDAFLFPQTIEIKITNDENTN